ncbi:hypothetical protein IPH67_01760 [bacterium]|nr:MAG: hypothetical protein IPH67_01760 [bacterium]
MTSKHLAQLELEESKNSDNSNDNFQKSLKIDGQLSTTVINNKTNKNVAANVFDNTPSKTERLPLTSTNLKIDDFKFDEVSIGDTGTKKTQPVPLEQTGNPAQSEQLPSQSQNLKIEDLILERERAEREEQERLERERLEKERLEREEKERLEREEREAKVAREEREREEREGKGKSRKRKIRKREIRKTKT